MWVFIYSGFLFVCLMDDPGGHRKRIHEDELEEGDTKERALKRLRKRGVDVPFFIQKVSGPFKLPLDITVIEIFLRMDVSTLMDLCAVSPEVHKFCEENLGPKFWRAIVLGDLYLSDMALAQQSRDKYRAVSEYQIFTEPFLSYEDATYWKSYYKRLLGHHPEDPVLLQAIHSRLLENNTVIDVIQYREIDAGSFKSIPRHHMDDSDDDGEFVKDNALQYIHETGSGTVYMQGRVTKARLSTNQEKRNQKRGEYFDIIPSDYRIFYTDDEHPEYLLAINGDYTDGDLLLGKSNLVYGPISDDDPTLDQYGSVSCHYRLQIISRSIDGEPGTGDVIYDTYHQTFNITDEIGAQVPIRNENGQVSAKLRCQLDSWTLSDPRDVMDKDAMRYACAVLLFRTFYIAKFQVSHIGPFIMNHKMREFAYRATNDQIRDLVKNYRREETLDSPIRYILHEEITGGKDIGISGLEDDRVVLVDRKLNRVLCAHSHNIHELVYWLSEEWNPGDGICPQCNHD